MAGRLFASLIARIFPAAILKVGRVGVRASFAKQIHVSSFPRCGAARVKADATKKRSCTVCVPCAKTLAKASATTEKQEHRLKPMLHCRQDAGATRRKAPASKGGRYKGVVGDGSRVRGYAREGLQDGRGVVGLEEPDMAVVEVLQELAVGGRSQIAGPDDWRMLDVRGVIDPF